MRAPTDDTIAALATAAGAGAIAVVRISGPDAQALAERFVAVVLELLRQLVEALDERWGDHRHILAQQFGGVLRLLGLEQLVDEAILRR